MGWQASPVPPSIGPCSWFCSELGLKGCELSVQWPRTYSLRPAVPAAMWEAVGYGGPRRHSLSLLSQDVFVGE